MRHACGGVEADQPVIGQVRVDAGCVGHIVRIRARDDNVCAIADNDRVRVVACGGGADRAACLWRVCEAHIDRPRAADDDVVAAEAAGPQQIDCIAPCAADDAVRSGAGLDDVGGVIERLRRGHLIQRAGRRIIVDIAAVAEDQVVGGLEKFFAFGHADGDRVGVAAADDDVVARAECDRVVAVRRVGGAGCGTGDDVDGSAIADDDVVPCAERQRIVAAAEHENIASIEADDDVGAVELGEERRRLLQAARIGVEVDPPAVAEDDVAAKGLCGRFGRLAAGICFAGFFLNRVFNQGVRVFLIVDEDQIGPAAADDLVDARTEAQVVVASEGRRRVSVRRDIDIRSEDADAVVDGAAVAEGEVVSVAERQFIRPAAEDDDVVALTGLNRRFELVLERLHGVVAVKRGRLRRPGEDHAAGRDVDQNLPAVAEYRVVSIAVFGRFHRSDHNLVGLTRTDDIGGELGDAKGDEIRPATTDDDMIALAQTDLVVAPKLVRNAFDEAGFKISVAAVEDEYPPSADRVEVECRTV